MAVYSDVGVTAQTIMENAVTKFGSNYRFTATYFGSAIGYKTIELNGVANNKGCIWKFYTRRHDGVTILSPVGITNFHIIHNGLTIIQRYESVAAVPGR